MGGTGIGIGDEAFAGEARLRELARAQAAVADLGRRALEGADTAELMQAAAETVVGMLGVDLGGVLELLPDGDLQVRATFGWDESIVGLVVPGGASSFAGFTIVANGPVVMDELVSERRFTPHEVMVREGVVSAMAVPLRGLPRPFGVLTACSRTRRSFDEDEVNILRSAGNVLAAAIGRGRIEDSLRQANSLLEGVIGGSADAVFVKDVEGRYVLVNRAGAAVMGRPADEIVGATSAGIFGADAAAPLDRHDQEVITTASPHTFEETIPVDGEERIFLSTKSPYFDREGHVAGVVGIARDITERKRMEERQRFLAQASGMLDTSLDPSETLQTIANLAVPGVADLCVIDLLEDDGTLHGVAVAALSRQAAERLIELRNRAPIDPAGDHPVAQVLRARTAKVFPELEDRYSDIAQSDDHLAFAREQRYRSAVVAPLTARGRTLGAISLIRYETAARYRDDDLGLARDLARRAATALDNARLFAHEHDVSVTLQRSLLPESLPQVPGLRFAARYIPGGPGMGVGGDWYDALPLARGKVGLAIGDVAGRGLRAASVMGQLRNTLRVFGAERSSAGAVIAEVDRVFQRLEGGEMATLLFMILDPSSGELHYSAAAHPPPLLITPDGEARYLDGGRSLPLGVAPSPKFHEAEDRLEPGSTLLLYTDGLVERPGESIDDGLERLRRLAAATPGDEGLLLDRVLLEMLDDSLRPDDVALLAVHATPVEAEFELRLDGPREELAALRDALRVWLGRHGVETAYTQDVTLACSEAAANAMEHAYRSREGPVEIHARMLGDRVSINVRDSGRWRAPQQGERGRGLSVIQAVVDDFELVKGENGTEVRMGRKVAGS